MTLLAAELPETSGLLIGWLVNAPQRLPGSVWLGKEAREKWLKGPSKIALGVLVSLRNCQHSCGCHSCLTFHFPQRQHLSWSRTILSREAQLASRLPGSAFCLSSRPCWDCENIARCPGVVLGFWNSGLHASEAKALLMEPSPLPGPFL